MHSLPKLYLSIGVLCKSYGRGSMFSSLRSSREGDELQNSSAGKFVFVYLWRSQTGKVARASSLLLPNVNWLEGIPSDHWLLFKLLDLERIHFFFVFVNTFCSYLRKTCSFINAKRIGHRVANFFQVRFLTNLLMFIWFRPCTAHKSLVSNVNC